MSLAADFQPEPAAGIAVRYFGFDLFADARVTGVAERFERLGPGRGLYTGRIEGVPGGQFLLAYDGRAVAASIDIPGRSAFQVRPAGGDRVSVIEMHPDHPMSCATEPADAPASAPGLAGVAAAQAIAHVRNAMHQADEAAGDHASTGDVYGGLGQQGSSETGLAIQTVDLLFLYTSAAVGANGTNGVAGMNASIDLMVGRANSSMINSGAGVRFRVAHRALDAAYTETGNSVTEHNRLSTNGDGFLDAAHSLRTTHAADLVTLIVNDLTDGFAGRANIFNGNDTSAFAVVELPAHDSSFTHEAGHLFGCLHNRANNSSNGPKGNSTGGGSSFGYEFAPAGFPLLGTVMNTAAARLRIPYFSNPDVTYLGVATGVALAQPQPCHNADTIEFTKNAIAAFRVAPSNQPPSVTFTAPAHLFEIAALSSVTINATATDADGNVTRVDFYLLRPDSNFGISYGSPYPATAPAGSDLAAPFQFTATAIPAGYPIVVAAATDNSGAVGFSTLALAANPHFVVSALPLPAGFNASLELRGINSLGRIVGHAGNATGTLRACRWDGSVLTQLDPLAGDPSARAFGVDEGGNVYGQSINATTSRAVRWNTGATTATDLSALVAGQTLMGALGADESSPTRRILGNRSATSPSAYRAVPGNATALPTNARGLAINADGVVTGYDFDGVSAFKAMRWSSGSSSTILGQVPGFLSSWGRAIAPTGAVAGWNSPLTNSWSSTNARASFWSANSTSATDLGTVGRNASRAYGINRFEDVVGTSVLSTGFNTNTAAFLRRAGGPATDLDQFILLPARTRFLSGDAINERGEIAVTGEDTSNGTARAYRLTPMPGLSNDYWTRKTFTAAQISNGTASDAANPDNDDLNNLAERAFGLNPLVADTETARAVLPSVTHQSSDGRLYLTFRRLKAPRDLSYVVERTSSLSTASWTSSGIEQVSIDAFDPGTETATYRTTAPAADPREFLRVRITRP